MPLINISPRIGISWDPFGDGKSSIRAGFSIAYGPHHEQSIAGAPPNAPDVIAGVLQPGAGIGTQILYGIPVPYNPQFARGINAQGGLISRPGEPAIRLSPWVVNPNIKTQYAESWFFNIQREVAKDWTVELGYIGTTGVNLERIDDINRQTGNLKRINQNFDTLLYVTNGVGSHYNAFTAGDPARLHPVAFAADELPLVQVARRRLRYFRRPVRRQLQPRPRRTGLLLPSLRIRQVAFRHPEAFLYRHPLEHAVSLFRKQPFPNALARGWTTSFIATVQSGRPFSVWCGSRRRTS